MPHSDDPQSKKPGEPMPDEGDTRLDPSVIDRLRQMGYPVDEPPDNDTIRPVGISAIDPGALKTVERPGLADSSGLRTFGDEMLLRIEVTEAADPLLVDIREEAVIGRADTGSNYMPEIDFAPFGAYRLGLSRKHALLRRRADTLELVDLGSRNGTSVNGEPLHPDQPHVIHAGDEVRFASLRVRFLFQARD